MKRSLISGLVAVAVSLFFVGTVAAQDNPRFGQWKLKSDNPPPALNIMTYAPYGDGGMKVTIESTNGDGETTSWGYVTMFKGEFHPVENREGSESAVEIVDQYVNKISNSRDGRVTQVIMNVLSADGNTIDNEYINYAADGTERGRSTAVYERIR